MKMREMEMNTYFGNEAAVVTYLRKKPVQIQHLGKPGAKANRKRRHRDLQYKRRLHKTHADNLRKGLKEPRYRQRKTICERLEEEEGSLEVRSLCI
ncbi:MAG: hypothetical protein ACI4W2_09285 [Eubacterium sp.]